ncbi:MAG: CpsD/CapB family tyrosine-protein kinase [Eubacterium sp.]|nr:CpsD/CapB family tyrosine-protein kinase [Eubacterium sp.]MEE3398614.1 CpsD/CapB family tyrosine-protein kinase [Eubacterium sp.]
MEKIVFENIKDLEFKVNESYKRVRTNISFSGDNIKAIAVTSSVPNEGKTEVCFNIARSFADDGKKVLFIDADIRKSVVIARYGVDKETKGLSHYLSGQAKLDEIIYETNVNNLDTTFTGIKSPNPAELLGSEKFKNMIETCKQKYDYIIIDCPPLGSVIDAVLVAKVCDGSILVIESDYVSYKVVQNVKKQLETGGCKILGAILNKVPNGGKGYYGNYKGNYGYYDDYGYGE